MSLDKYLSDSRRLDAERVKHCVSLGSQGEDLFKELTNAMKTDVEEDKQHIDFYWDGRRVDVKCRNCGTEFRDPDDLRKHKKKCK